MTDPAKPWWSYPTRVMFDRAKPFIFAIAIGLALLPVQDVPVDRARLAIGISTMVAVIGCAFLMTRIRNLPSWLPRMLPYLYLLTIVVLRSATGGPRSGYVALLFLAPFWVALYDNRRQVIYVTVALFFAQAGPNLFIGETPAGIVIRGSLMTTLVIGMMSLAVQRNVEALHRARDRIRHEAEARAVANARLAESNEALARSNRDLEQFAYVSSHDLQEPLRMIRSFSQLFMQRHGASIDEDGRELLEFVVDGAERAQALVADLLEYSRIGTGERALEVVDLDAVIERAIDVLAPQIEATGARVFREPGAPTVIGEPQLLERLFVNLLGNAIKYRHPDRRPEIRVTCARDGNHVRVDVIDNGIGFDDTHSERIFQMFQRLHARGEYDGTGIGLAICTRIVERHGGTIRAHGEPGVGSTFTFTVEVDG